MSEPTQPARPARATIDDPEQARLIGELDEVMATFLPPAAPSAAIVQQLMAAIEHPPQRYAPFFARIAALFDLSEDEAIAACARLAEPRSWRFAGLPGIKNMVVQGGPRVREAEALFVRFAPGLRFPRHVHTGPEHVLVLEGSYVDSSGTTHGPGELRSWEAGTRHGFRVGLREPCIAATVVFGRDFEALPLRLLARVLGR